MRPCIGHEALYDTALFDTAPQRDRLQAVHRAAALCGSCPEPCEQKVTAGSGPVELVLLAPGWMPKAREGKPDTAQPGPLSDSTYVPPRKRVAVWAEMAAKRAALGHQLADIAADLLVSEDTARELIALGQSARYTRAA